MLRISTLIVLVTMLIASCGEKIDIKPMQVFTDSVIVLQNEYVLYANLVDSGTGVVTYGHCWSTDNVLPNVESSFLSGYGHATELGTYTTILSELPESTNYFVRAYATNGVEFTYGKTIEFTTRAPLDTWERIETFTDQGRTDAVMFAIENSICFVGGYDGLNYRKDMWEFNTQTKTWKQLAPFGGGQRSEAVGFAVGGHGYMGTGRNYEEQFADFWKYLPKTNEWVKLEDFGQGLQITQASLFVIDSSGYIVNGLFGSPINICWEYNTDTDTWIQRASFAGEARVHAAAFSYKESGYIALGETKTGYANDIWEYSKEYDNWRKVAVLPKPGRASSVAFTKGDYVYLLGGFDGEKALNELIRYDLVGGIWQVMTPIKNDGIYGHKVVVISGLAYIALGKGDTNYRDIWMYIP